MPVYVPTDGRGWTYGAEHELADWDTRKDFRPWGRDPEPNIVNSNGIAADPWLKSYPFGAEINSPPTEAMQTQGDLLENFLKIHPEARANWRCGMHVHIRVPGLRNSLPHLKKLARYIYENRAVYKMVDVLPRENERQHPTDEERRAARRRYNWMRMSHMTVIPEYRVEKQEAAKTLQEFFEAEVPRSKSGKPLWHAQPRAAVNLRQLLQTDTIEFRHFAQTLNPYEVVQAVNWCRDYLLAAFDSQPAVGLFESRYDRIAFPKLDTIYTHWQELRWLATTPTKNKRPVVEANIALFLEEDRINGRRYD